MNEKKLTKWGLKDKLGDIREEKVKTYYENEGYDVRNSDFSDDVLNQLDLIATKKNTTLYIQVKGFHDNWKNENFDKLIDKAKEDKATPIIVRVNKRWRMYFWNPLKK